MSTNFNVRVLTNRVEYGIICSMERNGKTLILPWGDTTMTNDNGIMGTLTIGYDDITRGDVIAYTTRYTAHDGRHMCVDELEREIITCALRDYPDWQFVNWKFGNDAGCVFNSTNVQRERCEYGKCDNVATEICDTCGALLCDEHVIVGAPVDVDGVDIPYTYCRKFACINGKPAGIVPYITCA